MWNELYDFEAVITLVEADDSGANSGNVLVWD